MAVSGQRRKPTRRKGTIEKASTASAISKPKTFLCVVNPLSESGSLGEYIRWRAITKKQPTSTIWIRLAIENMRTISEISKSAPIMMATIVVITNAIE
jgi:hypothetical protein